MQIKNLGIFALLIAIVVFATVLNGTFVDPANLKTLVRDTSLYGLISIGVAFVIMTGGIDLSIGSVIALCGVMLVQVINIRYEKTEYEFRIVQTRTEEGADGTKRYFLQLDGQAPTFRDGDRLVYRSTTGESAINLRGEVFEGRPGWIESRDSLRTIRSGMSVTLSQIRYTPPLIACGVVLGFAALVGLLHGVLITKVHLQPFVVTLCGLLVYRGLARVWTGDDQVGLLSALAEFKQVITGAAFDLPIPFIGFVSGANPSSFGWVWIDFPVTGVLLAIVAWMAWLFLSRTIWGRYLLATGENEQAARFSGVPTDSMVIFAYVVCALLAGLAGILFTLEWNSVQPNSSGAFYELYAIAAAVLGGCSLRGGRGAVLGVIAGAAVMRCLYKAIVVLGIPQQWEMVIIGTALLLSVVTDELIRRYQAFQR